MRNPAYEVTVGNGTEGRLIIERYEHPGRQWPSHAVRACACCALNGLNLTVTDLEFLYHSSFIENINTDLRYTR